MQSIVQITRRLFCCFVLILAFFTTAQAAFFDSPPDLLDPEKAFRISARVLDPQTAEVEFQIAKGYYMYRDRFRFSTATGKLLAEVDLPHGKLKRDEFFGETQVFRDLVKIKVPLEPEDIKRGRVSLNVTSQGCSDSGVCYVPLEQKVEVDMVAAAGNGSNADNDGNLLARLFGSSSPTGSRAPVDDTTNETDGITRLLHSGNFWWLIAGFFGFGLLLAFTPCMLPMIPILSGIIVGQKRKLSGSRAFLLSSSYVLGMALTYTALGIAAGLSGTLLSSALQNPWVLGSFAAIFVFLALSMFGLYTLQLPAAWQNRIANFLGKLPGGTFAGVFIMGMLSAVIVGPCVAVPLAGALLYIGQTGNIVLGGSALFAMALGMGAPLLVIGASAGALLPKAGQWTTAVERFFGVLLLGTAIWIVSPVIPVVIHMLLWAVLLIMSAVYLKALEPLASEAHPLGKGIGIISLLIGIALLAGALGGSRDILQPLGVLRSSAMPGTTISTQAHLPFARIRNTAELDARLLAAKKEGRQVMLDFYADWCVACKEMERFTFSDPRVHQKLKNTVLLQADVTGNTKDDTALLRRFGLFGPPGIIFFDASGTELPFRVIGFQSADRFLASLERVINP